MISLILEIRPFAILSGLFAITIGLLAILGYTGKTKVKSGKYNIIHASSLLKHKNRTYEIRSIFN